MFNCLTKRCYGMEMWQQERATSLGDSEICPSSFWTFQISTNFGNLYGHKPFREDNFGVALLHSTFLDFRLCISTIVACVCRRQNRVVFYFQKISVFRR